MKREQGLVSYAHNRGLFIFHPLYSTVEEKKAKLSTTSFVLQGIFQFNAFAGSLSTPQPAWPPACLSVCVCLSVCLSVCLFVRPSVRLSVCLSVCLSACVSVCPSVHPSVCLCVCLPAFLPACLPAYQPVCLLSSYHYPTTYLQHLIYTIDVAEQRVGIQR